ncbi:MAG: response regulator transcription factor, partial [Anaerolineae bacterium]|nr:response regulator transcription factor [Anaerolineae bacterium]
VIYLPLSNNSYSIMAILLPDIPFMSGSQEHIFPAIRAGALSYILKSVKAPELADAIRKAVNNEAVLHPQVAARVVQEIHGSRMDEVNPFIDLTDREMDVLQLLAQGLNNQEIADKMFITIKTVRSHTSNILSKLHLQDRTQAAIYAWQQGIVYRHD